jgi:hypothetical protein
MFYRARHSRLSGFFGNTALTFASLHAIQAQKRDPKVPFVFP